MKNNQIFAFIWSTTESLIERLGSELLTGRSLFVFQLQPNNISPPFTKGNSICFSRS